MDPVASLALSIGKMFGDTFTAEKNQTEDQTSQSKESNKSNDVKPAAKNQKESDTKKTNASSNPFRTGNDTKNTNLSNNKFLTLQKGSAQTASTAGKMNSLVKSPTEWAQFTGQSTDSSKTETKSNYTVFEDIKYSKDNLEDWTASDITKDWGSTEMN